LLGWEGERSIYIYDRVLLLYLNPYVDTLWVVNYTMVYSSKRDRGGGHCRNVHRPRRSEDFQGGYVMFYLK
jgi:hypothetical protein